ncbi:hypothetical protein [Paenibacillus xylaniclasticus]|uniref:hypothetical protein n=1 Tax=Paenibacillus xylaniclasticus TaxID=588083 RepID=UPI000FDBC7FA|nr:MULTISPECIES: hypothetical protein [Paenibacillus]
MDRLNWCFDTINDETSMQRLLQILIVSDEESKYIWDHFDRTRLKDIKLIISCGDGVDECHRGFQCFVDYIDRYQPKYVFHGH